MKNLIVPVYLDQSIVFDMVATIEDGISFTSQVNHSAAQSGKNDSEVSGEIGISNAFKFLPINLNLKGKGGVHKEEASNKSSHISTEKMHTPSSLFVKLLDYLTENKIAFETLEEGASFQPGQIWDFRVRLQQNPFTETLDKYVQCIDLLLQIQKYTSSDNVGQKSKGKPKQDPDWQQLNQIKTMLSNMLALERASSQFIIIGDLLDFDDIKIISRLDATYWRHSKQNLSQDGEHHLVCKIVRSSLDEAGTSVSLFKNSGLGVFPKEVINELLENLSLINKNLRGDGLPTLISEVESPFIEAIPIGIYV